MLAGAGAALVPETLARFAEQLGAVATRPDPPAVHASHSYTGRRCRHPPRPALRVGPP